MKRIKKLSALLCAATLLISLGACGNKTEEVPVAAPTDAIIAASQKATEATSMSATTKMHIDMAMSEGGQDYNIDMNVDMDIDMIMEPIQMQITYIMDMGELLGGAIEGDVYITEKDGVYTSHSYTFGQWTTEEVPLGDLEQYNVQSTMQLYLSSAESFTSAGEETLESGITATKYTGVISKEALDEVINSSGVSDSFAGFATGDNIDWNALYQDLGELPISIWVSTEGYPIRYEIDMTALMDKMFANMMAQLEESNLGTTITINAVTMSMDCDYNTVTDITIPAEALAE